MFPVKVEQFEGPLDLLLSLIEREKLNITEVSMAAVTDQYLLLVKDLADRRQLEELADFLVVAARLLLIKSRSILPQLSPQEEEEIGDLERRLKIFQEFHDASKGLEEILASHRVSFFRPKAIREEHVQFSPPKLLKPERLSQVFLEIISQCEPIMPVKRFTFDSRISIQDKIAELKEVIAQRLESYFHHLIKDSSSRTEIIVSFLALLELVKQRQAVAMQNDLFDDIKISAAQAVESVSSSVVQ